MTHRTHRGTRGARAVDRREQRRAIAHTRALADGVRVVAAERRDDAAAIGRDFPDVATLCRDEADGLEAVAARLEREAYAAQLQGEPLLRRVVAALGPCADPPPRRARVPVAAGRPSYGRGVDTAVTDGGLLTWRVRPPSLRALPRAGSLTRAPAPLGRRPDGTPVAHGDYVHAPAPEGAVYARPCRTHVLHGGYAPPPARDVAPLLAAWRRRRP
mgnify:FL=1